jgi:hypothetical protein
MNEPRPAGIAPPLEEELPPRYAPERELPPYRYVPGVHAHPTAHEEGHSYARAEPDPPYLPAERWAESIEYLYGVDLFNRRFYWEAHEAWEAVWHTCNKSGTQGLFVQGLIQISAALLRWHMGTERGARKLHRDGRAKLERAARESPLEYMGISIATWIDELDRIFARLFELAAGTQPAPALPVIHLQRDID